MGDVGQTMIRHGSVEVAVRLVGVREERHDVHSKIATLIGDLRVGRVTLIRNEERGTGTGVPLRLARYDVAAPYGIVPHVEVDLQITATNNNQHQRRLKHLQVFEVAHATWDRLVGGHRVYVRMNWDPTEIRPVTEEQEFVMPQPQPQPQPQPRPNRPVEVKMMPAGHITVTYTIGDVLSFTEFIMAIRHIVADHPDRTDILDDHDLLINLASTRQHPVLAKMRGMGPTRWLYVKLQAVAPEGEETWCTTLLMRGDNLYVSGFLNQQGRAYALIDDKTRSLCILPEQYTDNQDPADNCQRLEMSVRYRSMLRAESAPKRVALDLLRDERLDRDFVMEAIGVLSSYGNRDDPPPPNPAAAEDEVGRKLAGLILMVCESARMNPVHDSFARGWTDGTGFTGRLMRKYVWNRYWGRSSCILQEWKSTQQYERVPHQPVEELQDIYLVLNSPAHKTKQDKGSQQQQPAAGNNNDPSGNTNSKPGDTGRDDGSNPATGGSGGGGGGSGSRKKRRRSRKGKGSGGAGAGAGSSGGGGPAESQGNKKDSKGSGGGPAESQGYKASNAGRGRPLVELLAMHLHDDLIRFTDTTIAVFDGKRGQAIYGRHKEQGGGYHQMIGRQKKDEEGLTELVLTGPYRGISGYGCFAIKIDTPAAATGSSSDTLIWEWDCYAPDYAAQVDEPEPARHFITDNNDRKVAKVTYAVMSDALDATVQVKLRLKHGHVPSGACGKIGARIDGFQVGSVLFDCENWSGDDSFSPAHNEYSRLFLLHLARDVVAVPCGKVLHIEMDLHIRTSNDSRPEDKGQRHHCKVDLPFNNAFSSQQLQRHPLDGGGEEDEVQVSIIWSPETEMYTAPDEADPSYPFKEPKPPIAVKGKEVTCAKFIASKKWIMTGCSSGIIYVYGYDPEMSNPVRRIRVLRGHTKSVNSLALHATRPYALSASQDGKIFVWDYENKWNILKTIHAKSPVAQVAFNPKDTNTFASAQDTTVKIWDLHSGDCKLELLTEHYYKKVLCLDYFSLGDKLYLITGSKDTNARIWDCETGSCVQTLRGHTSAVQTVCFHPDLLILITGSWDRSIRLWLRDSTTFRYECKLNFGFGEVYAIASLKGSTRIVIGHERGLVEKDLEEVISSTSNKAASHQMKDMEEYSFQKEMEEFCSSLDPASATSRELGQVVTDTCSFSIDMLSSSSKPLKLRLPNIAQMVSSTLEIRNSTDYHAAFSLCSTTTTNNTAKYDMLPSGGVVPPQLSAYVRLTRVVAQNKKGLPAVSADLKSKDELVVTVKSTVVDKNTTDVTNDLFTTETGRDVYTVELAVTFAASELLYKIKSASTIDVHPTEPWMVIITPADKFVRTWDCSTKPMQEVKKWSFQIPGVKVSLAKFVVYDRPNNRKKQWIVAGTTSGLLYVYDCGDSRKEPISLLPNSKQHSKPITSLAVHATKPRVLSVSMDGKILLWDYANDWKLVKAFDSKTQCLKQVAFNPCDADMFATAQDDTVKIWSLDHGERRDQLSLSGHSGQIECLDYCTRGDEPYRPYVITGSRDNTAKIWDSKKASCVQTLEGHAGHVTIVRYHPGLSMLITGSRDGSIRLWNSTTFRLERELKFDLGSLSSVACLKGSTRIAMGYEKGLVLADISTQETRA